MVTYFGFTSVAWTWVFSITLFLAVVKETTVEKYEKVILWIICTVPVLLWIFPATTNSYGPTETFCWIVESNLVDSIVWQLVCFYIILYSVIVINSYLMYRVVKEIYSDDSEVYVLLRKTIVKTLISYPLVLIACWFFSTILFIW